MSREGGLGVLAESVSRDLQIPDPGPPRVRVVWVIRDDARNSTPPAMCSGGAARTARAVRSGRMDPKRRVRNIMAALIFAGIGLLAAAIAHSR